MTEAAGDPPRHLGLADAAALYADHLGSGISGTRRGCWRGAVTSRGRGARAAGAVIAHAGRRATPNARRASRPTADSSFQREAYGPAIAFVGGWAAIFVTYPASIAAIAMVFASYLAEAMGLAGYERGLAAALVGAALLNVAGLRTGPRAQLALTVVKLEPWRFSRWRPWRRHRPPGRARIRPRDVHRWHGRPVVLGTDAVALDLRRLVRRHAVADACRTATWGGGPAGMAILAVVYALVQVAVHHVLGVAAATSERPSPTPWRRCIAGRTRRRRQVVSTLASILADPDGVAPGASHARDGAFLRSFAGVHSRLGTPVPATAATTGPPDLRAVASFRGS